MTDTPDAPDLDEDLLDTYRRCLADVDRTDEVLPADLERGPNTSVRVTPEFRAAMREIPADVPETVRARMRGALFDLARSLQAD